MNLKFIYNVAVILAGFAVINSTTQAAVIKGKVEDTSGVPLNGANIFLKETTHGTTTKHLGQYAINSIPAGNYDLVITFVGFERKEITHSLEEN